MTWIYKQATGEIFHNADFISVGYSGKNTGKNNPKLQGMVGVGPIPKGKWHIGYSYDSRNTGPLTIMLDAVDAKPGDDRHEETGRGAFRIHGDSIKAPGTASRGCIILPRHVRERIIRSKDNELIVE